MTVDRAHCKHRDWASMTFWRNMYIERQLAMSEIKGSVGRVYPLARFARDLQAERVCGKLTMRPPCYSTLKKYMRILAKADADLTFFPKCGHREKTEIVERMVEAFGANAEGTCFTCQTVGKQEEDLVNRNKAILDCLNSAEARVNLEWPEGIHEITLKSQTNLDIPGWLKDDWDFQILWTTKLFVRKLDLCQEPASISQMNKYKGGLHPGPDQFTYNENQVLENPGDGTIGLVTWPTCKGIDFAMIGTVALRNEDVVSISCDEATIAWGMPTAKRGGAAAGPVFPSQDREFDHKSASRVTKPDRMFIKLDGSNATSCKLVYYNHDSKRVVVLNDYSSDVLMLRNSKQAKRQGIQSNRSVLRKTIAEMESRVKALAVTAYFQLDVGSNRCLWYSLQRAVHICDNPSVREKWLKVDESLSMLHIVLLEYACGTGEMRNHQALHAHVDANRSHYIESMMLFGRVRDGETRKPSTIVKSMQPGLLCMIWQRFAFRMRCGRDVLHLQLSNTMHVPDLSLNNKNFSWVHGP